MWDEDWARLGIEPTTDLPAIKKAYAAKLKTTRPDDDAQAYQALRGAYERAQQWAKWQAAEDAQPGPPEPAAASLDAPTVAVEEALPLPVPAVPELALTPPVDPRELIESLELSWRRAGGAALWADWPAARTQLDETPLRLRAEVSAQFARWVLRLPQLPDDFVGMLNDHFGWLSDFRAEREIGGDLVQALHEALDTRLQRPLNDPAVLALAEPLLRFNAHRRQARWLASQAFAIVLQPLLARPLQRLAPRLMRRLGLLPDEQAELRALVLRAAWLRFALLALGFCGVSLALGNPGGETLLRVISWGIASLLMLGTTVLIGGLINIVAGLARPPRIGRLLQAWRHHRSQPLLGLGLIVFVAALTFFDLKVEALMHPSGLPASGGGGGWLTPALLGLVVLVGALLAWPLDTGHGFVCVGASPLVCTLFALWLLPALPTATSVLLALAWMLAASGVREGRMPVPDLLAWPLRPMLNSFTLVDSWGLTTAMAPLFCTFAYAMLPGPKPDGTGLFLTWVLSNIAIGWLQGRGEAWALARLSRA